MNDTPSAAREALRRANAAYAQRYPGEATSRQPVHIVHEGAHLFSADRAVVMGKTALEALESWAPDATALAHVLGLRAERDFASKVYERVVAKLEREPVEDYRIDFEDGFGARTDAEEDTHARRAAAELARGLAEGTLPPFVGIRLKPFSEERFERSRRTLTLFVDALVEEAHGAVPRAFVVTLSKAQLPEQVAMLAELLDGLERRHRLGEGALGIELMIETAQALFDAEGQPVLRRLVEAGRGRCRAVNFGAYDFTASCHIVAPTQGIVHPTCDFARHLIQVTLAGTGVALADGATSVLPAPPHPGPAAELSTQQRSENSSVVNRAWQMSYRHLRASLERGYYRGVDLHPNQLPIRYAAFYAFFLEGLEPTVQRMRGFFAKAKAAGGSGALFDDAATGQGLLNFLHRGLASGALTPEEVAASGLTAEELDTRSFAEILDRRRGS